MASADGSAGLGHQRKFPRSLPVFCAPRVPVLVRMSALGQKRICAAQKLMSAVLAMSAKGKVYLPLVMIPCRAGTLR